MDEQATRQTSGSSLLVRRVSAMHDFEIFFVSAVATILLVRAILAATGWPQLGGGKIHFAHPMWGGVGMLIAFILFMAMQGRLWEQLATLSAGIGFGLFLDELGKFITFAILGGAFFSFYQNQVGAVFGLLWLLLTLAVIRALISAELVSAATQLQQSTDGGADAAHQV